MSKPILGLLLGAVLGLLDGMGAYAYPEVREQIVGIMIGSTFKGLVTGLATGFFATRFRSLPLGMLVGFAIGCLLSFIVAAMPDPANPGKHFYLEIMLPGSILGAVVGYATYRFGRAPRSTAVA